MKTLVILCSFLIIKFGIFGQTTPTLKTIKAKGGEGQNVNWQKIKIEEEREPDGPGFFYNGCSEGITPVKASSTLLSQGANNYKISNLNDQNPMTAWVEGKEDYGIGEYIEVKSVDVNKIYNGYQSSPTNWRNNSRVKKFKVYQNNKPLCFLILTDEMGAQHFDLPVKKDYNFDKPSLFKFEIMEVYPGLKWKDVAISEMDLTLCCFAENTLINGLVQEIKIEDLKNDEAIYSLNLETNQLEKTKVLKSTSQIHVTLITISTQNHTISVTENHPLFTKDHGFVSLSKLKTILQTSDYTELIDEVEFMVWDMEKRINVFEKLATIEVKEGKFKTYSIMELQSGTTFIANGFVTKTYK